MERVTDFIFPEDEFPQDNRDLFYMLRRGRAQMGGRILAGAATEHGNLLNCFVQDGSPYEPGSLPWIMELAKRLAQVTKVGGGNGLNLDPIAPKNWLSDDIDPQGEVFLAISAAHPDALNVSEGRFFDQVTGEYLTHEYHGVNHVLTYDLGDEVPDDGRIVAMLGLPETGHLEVIHVEDSIEGIWDAAAQMAFNIRDNIDTILVLNELRPEGTPVQGSGGVSSGAASFAVEVFDNFARWAHAGGAAHAGPVAALRYVFAPTLRVIRQAGQRRGAGMATLSATHPDVQDFITSKDLERERNEGDISTFNISVLADRVFMDEALDYTVSESAGVLGLIADQAHATGEPGLLYIDTINDHNPLAAVDGPIMATNPCGEVILYPGEPCDLGAINLAAYWDAELGDLDWDLLLRDTRLMVRALDRVLTLENAPIPMIREAIDDKRRIGLGVMGLADLLVLAGFRYDSDGGLELANEVLSEMTTAAIEESEALGASEGVPAGVTRAVLSDGEGMRFAPRRNIALMTVAPTGTISMMTGVSSGIEPIYSAITYRRIGTDYHQIIHPLLEQILNDLEEENEVYGRYWKETKDGHFWDMKLLAEDITRHHGALTPLLKDLPQDPRLNAFVTAHEIEPLDHVAMQGAIQNAFDMPFGSSMRYAGNSISKTINMANEATVEDVLNVYTAAYEEGCKGVTVYRDGSRGLQVLSTSAPEEETPAPTEVPFEELETLVVAAAVRDGRDPSQPDPAEEQEKQRVSALFEDFVRDTKRNIAEYEGKAGAVAWRARPQIVQGESHKYEINGGKLYVQAFYNEERELVEAWTPAPKGSSSHERTTHEIIGRLVSLSLKYGAPTEKIAEALEGHMDETGGIVRGVGYVGSRWDLVAHTLRRTEDHLEAEGLPAFHDTGPTPQESERLAPEFPVAGGIGPFCADCGSDHVAYVEGCMTCQVCGSSKCG